MNERRLHPFTVLRFLRKTLVVYLLPLVQVLFERNWTALHTALRQDALLFLLLCAVSWGILRVSSWSMDDTGVFHLYWRLGIRLDRALRGEMLAALTIDQPLLYRMAGASRLTLYPVGAAQKHTLSVCLPKADAEAVADQLMPLVKPTLHRPAGGERAALGFLGALFVLAVRQTRDVPDWNPAVFAQIQVSFLARFAARWLPAGAAWLLAAAGFLLGASLMRSFAQTVHYTVWHTADQIGSRGGWLEHFECRVRTSEISFADVRISPAARLIKRWPVFVTAGGCSPELPLFVYRSGEEALFRELLPEFRMPPDLLARTEQRAAQDKPAAAKALCQVAEPVQTAALASLATLPVLVAHDMAASLVGVLCNLLVVWMVQPALQLGILLLVCSAVPFLAAITNLTALVLSLWLKGLLWLVRCCAALPFASICLPQRYTLFALAVLGALAVCFWHARRLRLYLPAAALCTVLAVGLGVWMQRDVVQINLVGASNNPCVVCVQNGQAVVFFRGGESNWSAVQNYLAGRSRQEPALVVDLRAKPTQMEFSAAEIVTVQELADFTTRPVLDGLTLDLYHNKSANLAVLGVGERHIAVGAGRLALAEPVRVDVLCAPGTLSDSVQPDAILYTAAAPRWLDDAAGCTLHYGEDTPGLTLRPGRSMIWEEAQTIAVQ